MPIICPKYFSNTVSPLLLFPRLALHFLLCLQTENLGRGSNWRLAALVANQIALHVSRSKARLKLKTTLRILCGWTHILHQTGIAATGNYNFFNLLTMVLCLACFDDLHYDWLMSPLKMKTKKSLTVKKSPAKKTNEIEGSKMTTMMNLGSTILQLVQVVGLLYLIRSGFIRSNVILVFYRLFFRCSYSMLNFAWAWKNSQLKWKLIK